MRISHFVLAQRTVMVGFALVCALDIPGFAPLAANVVGTWTWSWTDAQKKLHKHVLEIESKDGNLTAREKVDDETSVNADDVILRGDEISFVVARGTRRAEYKGKVASKKSINGLVNVSIKGESNEYPWSAERSVPAEK